MDANEPKAIGTRALLVNVLVASWLGSFAYQHAVAFLTHPRLSLIIATVVEIAIATMFVIRAPSRRTSTGLWAWTTAIGGSVLPLLLRPVPGAQDSLVGQALQLVGGVFALAAVLALNRSFGVVPANRGVKSRGAYRFVRHPLYAAYTIGNVGYLLSNAGLVNACIVVGALALQVARITNEERLLSEVPEYAQYKSQTRWRLMPGVF